MKTIRGRLFDFQAKNDFMRRSRVIVTSNQLFKDIVDQAKTKFYEFSIFRKL